MKKKLGGFVMDTKQLCVANINMVFGKEEEPLISRIDDIVMPALKSGIIRQVSDRTRYIFENVELKEISEGEWIIQGLLIKDTILDVMSEYTNREGLQKTEKHIQSSPYSLFLIYLKNHRMVLVKNQSGSPDIRSFSGVFKYVIKSFVNSYNSKLKEEQREQKLPSPSVSITGIKTATSVKESLKNVEKINELVIKFFPLNAEWDLSPIYGEIDEQIRKTIQSKKGRMIFPSPRSKEGVAKMIEATEGLVETELKVTYRSEGNKFDDEPGKKRTGKIKDNQISEVMSVDIYNELDGAYNEVYEFGKDIQALNVQTKNHIIDYQRFIRSRKK